MSGPSVGLTHVFEARSVRVTHVRRKLEDVTAWKP